MEKIDFEEGSSADIIYTSEKELSHLLLLNNNTILMSSHYMSSDTQLTVLSPVSF